jgi:FkbM family methyltransferase
MRRAGACDLEIMYVNGLWTRRVGPHFFPDGPRFDYGYEDFSTWEIQADKYLSDAKDYWLRHYQAKEGDVIVDVGAGRGEDTLAFSKAVGNAGRVIAIEAHPLSFAILKSFCKLNGLDNVIPLNLALMDKPGAVRIVESETSWMENAVEYHETSSGREVRADTLDSVYLEQGLGDVAFVKMNIEGAERFALRGMSSMMPRVRQICVACHDFRYKLGHGEQFCTRAFVERFLTDNGFELASRPGDPRDYVRDHAFGIRRTHHK